MSPNVFNRIVIPNINYVSGAVVVSNTCQAFYTQQIGGVTT